MSTLSQMKLASQCFKSYANNFAADLQEFVYS